MKIKITYRVCDKDFFAIADTIAEAYEYVAAIIKDNGVYFPNTRETLSGYMITLVAMCNGDTTSHVNHIFKIERLDDPAEKGAAEDD